MGRRTRLGCLLVVCLVVVLGVGATGAVIATPTQSAEHTFDPSVAGTGAVTASGSTAGDVGTAATTDIRLTQTFSQLAEPGVYRVKHTYRLPDSLTGLEVTIPNGQVDGTPSLTGFTPVAGTDDTYEWDGETDRPTIEYRAYANQSLNRDGPIGDDGQLIFANTGEWGIVQRPSDTHSWQWQGATPVGLDRTTTVDGTGVASDVLVFLGAYQEYTRTANDQTFRLVVPDAADLTASRDEIFTSVANTSGALQVGDRDESVFMIAAPTEGITWGVRGLQTGPADFWVQDTEQLDTADNVWVHEYVHTRQSHALAQETRWMTEGTASYYAALFSYEQGRISYDAFRQRLDRGDTTRYRNVVLTDPGTWEGNNGNYDVGTLVTGAIDRQLRLETERSFQAVFSRMNAQQNRIEEETFLSYLEGIGNTVVREFGEQYTRTTDRPDTWSQSAHQTAFGPQPAVFSYSFESVRVSGLDRNTELGTQSPVTVAPGETVRVKIRVTNVGGEDGTYDVPVYRNTTVLEQLTGTLSPQGSQTHTVTTSFNETGTTTLAVEGVNLDITVSEGALDSGPRSQPGFTVGVAVVTLVGTLLGIGARYRS